MAFFYFNVPDSIDPSQVDFVYQVMDPETKAIVKEHQISSTKNPEMQKRFNANLIREGLYGLGKACGVPVEWWNKLDPDLFASFMIAVMESWAQEHSTTKKEMTNKKKNKRFDYHDDKFAEYLVRYLDQ